MNIKSRTLQQPSEPRLKSHFAVLGENIRRRRLDCRLSQERLAHRSGLQRTCISDVERAARNISFATLLRLAIALETTVSELTTDLGEPRTPAPRRGLVLPNGGSARKAVKVRAAAMWRRIAAVMATETCILDSFSL